MEDYPFGLTCVIPLIQLGTQWGWVAGWRRWMATKRPRSVCPPKSDPTKPMEIYICIEALPGFGSPGTLAITESSPGDGGTFQGSRKRVLSPHFCFGPTGPSRELSSAGRDKPPAQPC
ncbi:hypothetical protein B0T21DRAFT_344437 [Apiosordaria backusii]|uniref:Uncharacterized protein n=1 Tax=Apiosordaria backusii TaxID=314023 RepID=A0AA40F0P9_9PEZI|nr:hypothetical protein B0T21DRAFT_344437 [Apiosordaria backusii]